MLTFVVLAVIYVVGGVILAALIFRTAGQLKQVSGNADGALTMSFAGLKLSTTNVLVGLAVVVLIAMVGVPAYFLRLYLGIDDRRMGLTITFSQPLQGPVVVRAGDGASFKTQTPQLEVYKTRDHQAFSIENPDGKDYPIPIVVWYEWSDQHPWAIINNGEEQKIKNFDGVSGSIGPVEFNEAGVAKETGPNQQTRISGTSAAAYQLPDPALVQRAAAAVIGSQAPQ